MTDIPEDVMEAATDVVVSLGIGGSANPNPDGFTIRDAIARAILAERERCANVAKALLKFADTTSGADEAIPAAILDPNHWLARNPALVSQPNPIHQQERE